jgi:hypothetical protein
MFVLAFNLPGDFPMAHNRLLSGLMIGVMLVMPYVNPAIAADRRADRHPGIQKVASVFSWGDLLKLLRPKRTAGGTRGSGCWVTMGLGNGNTVAHPHPTLYWTGGFKKIGLRIVGEDTLLWEQAASQSASQGYLHYTRYDGDDLEPGVKYELVGYGKSEYDQKVSRFTLRSADQQAALNEQLQAFPGNDEATLTKRLNLYQTNQLPTEALDEMLTARSPSPALQESLKTIAKDWCSQD